MGTCMLHINPFPSNLKTVFYFKGRCQKHYKVSNSQDYYLKVHFTVACRKSSRICTAKASFSKRRTFFHQQIGLKYKEETIGILHLEHSFYSTETWTFREIDQKFRENCEMWCWRWMDIGCADQWKMKYRAESRRKRTSCLQ